MESDLQIRERATEDGRVYDILHDEHPMGWLYAANDDGPAWGWSRSDRKNTGRSLGFWQALVALLETFGKYGVDRRYEARGPFRAKPLHYKASDGILELTEARNGYYLYYNWSAKEWDTACVGDGVDMFTTEQGGALSPGTQPFNDAMIAMVEYEGAELVEAYFPDRAEDYFTRRGMVVASEREKLQAALRYHLFQSRVESNDYMQRLADQIVSHLTMRAMRAILARMEGDEQ
jgi:hypothetical protein